MPLEQATASRPLSASSATGAADPLSAGSSLSDSLSDPLQMDGQSGGSAAIASAASSAFSGGGDPLPHRDTIQESFGKHDISDVTAHTDSAAREAASSIGANGMASGNKVALNKTDLHTSAHEAAHTIQQKAGVQLSGGVGQSGDRYERHADAVADTVVAGGSAEPLLDGFSGGGGTGLQFDLETWSAERKAFISAEQAPTDGEAHDGAFQDVVPDPTRISSLKGGKLSLDEALALPAETVQQIDPKSDVPKWILRRAVDSSWHKAKENFAAGGPAPQLLMRKLWEYRQWHHDVVLNRTAVRVNAHKKDPNGLKKWSAAGSAGLTSDIDVNLKGTHTEYAVKIFNEEFRKEYGKEAGVVYDVNVYALDFMHGVDDETGSLDTPDFGQEGARKGKVTGGLSDEAASRRDLGKQEEWATLKVRLYMTAAEWNAHKADVGGVNPSNEVLSRWARVEQKYKAYREDLRKAMFRRTNRKIDEAQDVQLTGSQQITAQSEQASDGTSHDPENVSIGASNDVYAVKLVQVGKARKELKALINTYNALVGDDGQAIDSSDSGTSAVARWSRRIDRALILMRERISEAALFSNEAYITDGAVNHGVVQLQMGKGVDMNKSQMFHAAQENYADALKEIARHGGTFGEAAFKSGKYIWRMGDAIVKIGLPLDAVRTSAETMREEGKEIANAIKKSGANEETKSATALSHVPNVTDIATLRAELGRVARGTAKEFQTDVADNQQQTQPSVDPDQE